MSKTGRDRLTEYRIRTRLKQKDLAELLDVTDSYLSQLLSGRRNPGLETALKIEEATGVPVNSWSASVRAESDRRRAKAARRARVNSELSHASTS